MERVIYMDRTKRLLSDSLIFFISTFGNKILTFLIVPFYTYTLTTAEYGTADAIVTAVSLILPIITAVIYDAALRFAMDKNFSDEDVLSEAFSIYSVSIVISVIIAIVMLVIPELKEYALGFAFILIFNGIYMILSQYTKGIYRTKEFAIGGTIYTSTFLIANVVVLSILKMGIQGYLASYIIAYAVASLYYFFILKAWKLIHFHYKNSVLRREMIMFGAPMILNTIIWWILTAIDKYFIIFFMGVSASGIYTVAHKIPTILTTLGGIFCQAWQLSAISENKTKNYEMYFEKIWQTYCILLILTLSSLMLISKNLITLLIESSYQDAWQYVGILLYSSFFTITAQFWSSFYVAEKKTQQLSISAFAAGIINLILGFLLVPIWGMFGAAVATVISCAVMFGMRVFFSRSFLKIKWINKRIIYMFILSLIQLGFYFLNSFWGIFCQVIILFLIFLLNYKLIISFFQKVFLSLRKKRGI